MRIALPNNRLLITEAVTFVGPQGPLDYIVSFGFDGGGTVREVFCNSPKEGSDQQGQITDACIAISLLLQEGRTMADLADHFGENRPEGAKEGPASSPYGAIARAGARIDEDVIAVRQLEKCA